MEAVAELKRDGTGYVIHVWGDYEYRPVAVGNLSRFPGSPSLWVSHGLLVDPMERGKGWSKLYHNKICDLVFNEMNGRAIVASVHTANKIQHARMEKLGWERLSRTLWIVRRPKNS